MSKETVEEVKVISPGAILKAAREKQGLSREEVADQLHLRFTIIKDLEEDQYATDISATFTKGYLKLYSKLLGVDEEPVLSAYQNLGTQQKEPAKLQSFSQKVARQASDQRLMWVTYLVLFLVAAGVIGWWIQRDDNSLSNFIDRNVSAATGSNEASDTSTATPDTAVTNSNTSSAPAFSDTSSNDTAFPAETSNEDTTGNPGAIDTESADTDSNRFSGNEQSTEQPELQTLTQAPSQPTTVTNDLQPQTAQSSVAPSEVENTNADSAEVGGSESDSSEINSSDAPINTQQNLGDEPALDTEAGVFSTLETGAQSVEAGTAEAFESQPDLPLADPVELVFTFSGDCWMKLTDATGEDVAYGIKQAGRIMPVSGVPPFEVVLGAPESVQISYAGSAIDMTRFRPGYTARFQLPLSE